MRILIGTPTYDYQVVVPYMTSVLKLFETFRAHRPDVTFDMVFPESSLLIETRNALATRVLDDASVTHLLFIDNDMGFQPTLIAKMLGVGQPFVGCFYPKRATDYDRLARVVRERPEATDNREVAAAYVGELWRDGQGRAVRRGEFMRASHLGTGILLLRRDALERLRDQAPGVWLERAPETTARRFKLTGGLFQGFNPLQREDGAFLGEDVSLCRRWTEVGGEIWGCITERITHHGRETFVGEYRAQLQAEGLDLGSAGGAQVGR